MGAGKIFPKIKSTCKMLSNESTFVVCSPFFQQATPGTHEIARRNCLKIGAGKIFPKIKSTLKCYRMNPLLSFAPNFWWMSPGKVPNASSGWVFD